jgi:hypothetical protein
MLVEVVLVRTVMLLTVCKVVYTNASGLNSLFDDACTVRICSDVITYWWCCALPRIVRLSLGPAGQHVDRHRSKGMLM